MMESQHYTVNMRERNYLNLGITLKDIIKVALKRRLFYAKAQGGITLVLNKGAYSGQ